jgi:hypothetical protein
VRAVTARSMPALVAIVAGWAFWSSGASPAATLPIYQLVLLVLAVAVTELLPIEPPRGRPVPTSTAVVATGALMGIDAPVLGLLTALGWTLARGVDRRTGVLPDLVVRVATAWVLGGLAAFGRTAGPAWQGAADSRIELHLLAAALVVLVLVAVLPALEVLADEARTRYPLRNIADEIRATGSADLAIAATAVMGALVHLALGPWTLPSLLVPLLAARIGLQRFAGVSRAYDQTIRAMSRLPEQLGTVPADHGVRVGQLARAVAMDLGLDAVSVLDVERAAYLHELGHIRLEPEDRPTRSELADAGARFIRSAGDLDRVAAIVAAHGDPAARRHGPREIAVPARIVAACCEAERYAPDLADDDQRAEVAVRLVRDVEDLAVVQAVLACLDGRTFTPRVPS